jgi:hypothetical protein
MPANSGGAMKTRASDEQARSGLPQPPAPTARDANPWQMSQSAGAKPHLPRHPRAPGWPPPPRSSELRAARRARRRPWIPVLILFFVVGSGVQMALRALAERNVESALGALLIIAAAAFLMVRRVQRARSEFPRDS